MAATKLLFIAFNGVVRLSDGGERKFIPGLVDRLVRLARSSDCKIVATGLWERSIGLPSLRSALARDCGNELAWALETCLFATWRTTPPGASDLECERWRKILKFCRRYQVDEFAILDDSPGLFGGAAVAVAERLVVCDPTTGLSIIKARQVAGKLARPLPEATGGIVPPLEQVPEPPAPASSPDPFEALEKAMVPKTAAEMTFAFGDGLDQLVNRFCDEWDVPVSIIIGCLSFKLHAIMAHHLEVSRKDDYEK